MKQKFFAFVILNVSMFAMAGDLDVLPDTESALREKITAFIKPGSKVRDAVTLLESFRFKCQELKEYKSTMWCDRWDGNALSSVKRRYQISLETDGALVKHVKTSTGLVGP